MRIVYTVKGDGNKTAIVPINIPDNLAVLDIQEAAVQIGTLLMTLSNGGLSGCTVNIELDMSLFAQSLQIADITSDIEEKGIFQFISTEREPIRMEVPCFDESKVLPFGSWIDLVDTDVAAFISAFENGIYTATNNTFVKPVSISGNSIVELDYAKDNHG